MEISETQNNNLVVKKFGGATLSTPEKVKQVAQHLADCFKKQNKIVAVVSAMGNTTNSLIELAHQISPHPSLREMDMLLSTGERVSMALLSMALQDLNCKAISFTGSQAGIITSEDHSNAIITDVRPQRIVNALHDNQIVILAGFQGMSLKTKEITTLGRGGSDTTAVAIAAALKAHCCEILKDVPAIFSGDPRIVPNAKPISYLSYSQLLNMTFWGAKVLHYRSVELSQRMNVPLYIGPAHSQEKGTWVKGQGESQMNTDNTSNDHQSYEKNKIISISSHQNVLAFTYTGNKNTDFLNELKNQFSNLEIYFPQVLYLQNETIYITAPQETIDAMKSVREKIKNFELENKELSSVTATCTSNSTSESVQKIFSKLKSKNLNYDKIIISGPSITVFIEPKLYLNTIQALHDLV